MVNQTKIENGWFGGALPVYLMKLKRLVVCYTPALQYELTISIIIGRDHNTEHKTCIFLCTTYIVYRLLVSYCALELAY